MIDIDTFISSIEGLYCIIRDSEGRVIYPKNPEIIQMFNNVLKGITEEPYIFRFLNKWYEYSDTVVMNDKLYNIELLKDITKYKYDEIAVQTDYVTGLFNTKLTHERFTFFIEESMKKQEGFTCAKADADHFKEINDIYGHEFGDVVLNEIAKVFLHSTRQNDLRGDLKLRGKDIVGRIGGEEFLIVFNNTQFIQAYNNVEIIRRKIERLKIPYNNEMIPSCTVSFGMHYVTKEELLNYDVTDADVLKQDILKKCDEALYLSKNNGRNRITVYEDNYEAVNELVRKKTKKE